MSDFGREIKKLRTRLGLTQAEFAKLLDCSRSYLRDIETGRTSPSRNFIRKVGARYGVRAIGYMFPIEAQAEMAMLARARHEFIYIFAFYDNELTSVTNTIRKHFANRVTVFADLSTTKTANAVLREITNRSGNSDKLLAYYEEHISQQDGIIILTGVSKSKYKDMHMLLRTLVKSTYTATLFVIDKPCFLEKNISWFDDYFVPLFYCHIHTI